MKLAVRSCSMLLAACMATCAFANARDDAELATLIQQFTDRSQSRTRASHLPDGTVRLDLGGGFQHVFLGQMGGNGELQTACSSSVEEASAFFRRDLWTGTPLPQRAAAPVVDHDMTGLAGMTPEEYALYWAMIEAHDASPNVARSSSITIVNGDGAGEGFNDTTSASPEGGNTGTTRGAQRLNLFNHAASIWAGFLDSEVPIRINAKFDPLAPCSSSGGVLGAAGPNSAIKLTGSGLPFNNTFYVAALANKFLGSDADAANEDIVATFNSSVDTGCLGAGSRFYYGLDNTTPAQRINLLIVVLHEIGHGLGFLSLVDGTTGALPNGDPDIWSHFMYDKSSGKTWSQMTNAQRVASATNTDNLLWDGPNVRIASHFLTAGRETSTGRVELYTPSPYEDGSSVSHWNTRAAPNLLMEPAINIGLPLTLDLTRQVMRDIGWFRDANNNGAPDAIGNVQPASGSLTPGNTATVSWNNPSGFSRNVTIELSTDGGSTFPTSIASNIVNTGSHAWTVPSISTTQARIRVREHDFVTPAGVSSGNFSIAPNTAPNFNSGSPLNRQRGSAAGNPVTVGTVNDAQTPAGNLTVTQIPGGSATGISVTGLSNNNGTITALMAASCTASSGTVRFQVSDGSLTDTGNLLVNVAANTDPTLSYANASVVGGAGASITPSNGPGDNGSVTNIVVLSSGTYTGNVSVNPGTGVVTLANAAPVGTHTLVLRATDNCGATRNANLQVTVNNTAPVFTPEAGIDVQQGSPAGMAMIAGSVQDAQTPAGSLVVTQIGGGTANGITASGLGNSDGMITAHFAASCTATSGTLRFQVSDGSLNGTGDLQVNVTANSPPTLAYADASVGAGADIAINPISGPHDNGSVSGITLHSAGTYTGNISVNAATGVVMLGNAAPSGMHTITLRATDNCGATRDAAFQLDVDDLRVFGNGFE